MKFSEMKYARPDYEAVSREYSRLLDELEQARGAEEFVHVFHKIDALRSRLFTMAQLSEIRHSMNTKDAFYEAENAYWDEHQPLYAVFDNRLNQIALNCPFQKELYDDIPKTWFQIAECNRKCFSEEIVPLLQKENSLMSEYGVLKASAEIPFEGKIYNLSTIAVKAEDPDRSVRKGASDAMLGFYSEHAAEFDRIYDDLVKVRTEIAHRLGYESFTEVGYLRMNRLDYDRTMVDRYRRQIADDIVPAVTELYARQAKRLGTPTVAYYDRGMEFSSGNPMPKGSENDLIQSARTMYHEMSEETGTFIDAMIEQELWDLSSRDGKEMGGYCTSLSEYGVPFIFANFNGTSDDVNVLTHEAGHAFQYWMSRSIPVLDVQWPTMESAEIASMTMEFNAWPWLSLFFHEDAEKYRFLHLSGTLKFLPYGVLVDHFQHEIYDHPDWTCEERKSCWARLEQLYRPYEDFEGAPLLENGGWWYRQGHIFEAPFYYIDYTLAQVCALQFWASGQRNDKNAWSDYVRLCALGGTRSFTELVKAANLRVPFEEGCLRDVVTEIHRYLNQVDDAAL